MVTLGKHAVWHDASFCDLFFDAHLPLSMPPLPASRLTPHQLSKQIAAPLHLLTSSLQRVLNAPREILASLHSHDMNQMFTLLERFTDLKDIAAKVSGRTMAGTRQPTEDVATVAHSALLVRCAAVCVCLVV